MASDRQQFNQAMRRWWELHKEHAYSVAPNKAKTVIGFSDCIDSDIPGNDVQTFRDEAEQLAVKVMHQRRPVEIIPGIVGDDMRTILRDRRIATIVLIGHGAMSYIYMENGIRSVLDEDTMTRSNEMNNRYDWRDVSRDADHLKTGLFVQRFCGNYARQLSVPLGAFALAKQSNVVAPVGSYFQPQGIFDEAENAYLGHVYDTLSMPYRDIKERFDYAEFQKGRRDSEAES